MVYTNTITELEYDAAKGGCSVCWRWTSVIIMIQMHFFCASYHERVAIRPLRAPSNYTQKMKKESVQTPSFHNYVSYCPWGTRRYSRRKACRKPTRSVRFGRQKSKRVLNECGICTHFSSSHDFPACLQRINKRSGVALIPWAYDLEHRSSLTTHSDLLPSCRKCLRVICRNLPVA